VLPIDRQATGHEVLHGAGGVREIERVGAIPRVDPPEVGTVDHAVVVRGAVDAFEALDRVVALTGRGPGGNVDDDAGRRAREVHGVEPLATDELVVASATGDHVPQDVAVRTAGDGSALDPIRSLVAREVVRSAAADDVLEAGERVGVAEIGRRGPGRQVDRRLVLRDDRVGPRAAVDLIVEVCTADERVVPVPSAEHE